MSHKLSAIRVSQDEVHLVCSGCSYKHAVPLLINGKYDGSGKIVDSGNKTVNHYYQPILNSNPPSK